LLTRGEGSKDWIAVCLLQSQMPTFTWKSSGKVGIFLGGKNLGHALDLFELDADTLQPRNVN